jgi:hypothetical protein
MERFEYYGELEKVVQGTGKLILENGNSHNVSFEIAKRGEEKLLFNVISDGDDALNTFSLLKSDGLDRIEGFDNDGRKVQVTGLFAKDSTVGTKTDSKVFLNGYAGKCEIGEKVFSDGFIAQFDLINFLFLGNKSVVKETERGEILSRSILELQFPEFECSIEQTNDYSITKQLLKRQGGVLKTSTLSTKVSSQNDYDSVHEKVRKLFQLLSIARSTFINWGACKIINNDGDIIYELYGNAITKPFHGNDLINELPAETESFLKSSWLAFDKYEEIFDLKRLIYGYLDTYMNTYIETRCLNIAALTDGLASRWAVHENREYFFEEKVFQKKLPKLKKGIHVLLDIIYDKIKKSYIQVMLSKTKNFNRRPLDWKLKRLRKAFQCPVTDEEIKQFVYIRDSLAHSALFPDDVDNKESFLFMRHFPDRIVLSVLGYSGKYFDMENRAEKILKSN